MTNEKKQRLLGWWFEPKDGRLGYGDGRKPRKGVTHKVKGQPVLCGYGLHASANPLDALEYAQSTNVWRVELGGVIVRGDDKATATERRYLWCIDAEAVLYRHARLSALDCVAAWEAPEVVIRWLKTGDESIRNAAYWAAYSAVNSAAYSAVNSAAYSAAKSAAKSAVNSAAKSAAYLAAYLAANSAAKTKQNKRLHRMLMEEARRTGVSQ